MRSLSLVVVVALMLSGCQPQPPSTTVVAGAAVVAGTTSVPKKKEGKTAPDYSGETVEGLPIRAADYRGKVVLLDFWATWCPPCRAEIPNEKALVGRMKGKPFALVGISADESRNDLRNFLADDPLPWVNISDPDHNISSYWRVKGYPTFVLIGADGKILEQWVGGGQSKAIDRAVETAVAELEAR